MPSATTVFLHHIFVACLLWLLACFHSEVLAHFNFTAHMSQRPRKQQKLDGVEWQSGFALRCLGSARRISEQISKLNEDQPESALSASRIRHLTSERLHELGNTMTPYGRLVQKHSALGPDINFISPHALIHYCASKSTEFAKFHASLATNGDPLSIVFYMDGATAGSDLRPAPRKYENIYWSFMEYPSWYRGRKAGWMTFLTIKKLVWWNTMFHIQSSCGSHFVCFSTQTKASGISRSESGWDLLALYLRRILAPSLLTLKESCKHSASWGHRVVRRALSAKICYGGATSLRTTTYVISHVPTTRGLISIQMRACEK